MSKVKLETLTIAEKESYLAYLINIRELANKHKDLVYRYKDSDLQIIIYPNDEKYKFFYHFEGINSNGNNKGFNAIISYAPVSDHDNSEVRTGIKLAQLETHFNTWIKRIKKHSIELTTFHPNDTKQKEYRDDFIEKFQLKLDEEDADTKPFETEKQLLIYKHLNNVISLIKDENKTEEKKEIKEANLTLIEAAKAAQESLGRDTKNEVLFKLADIYSKAQMYSMGVFVKLMNKGIHWGLYKMFDELLELS